MTFHQIEDQIINVLRPCFSTADQLQIEEDSSGEETVHCASDIIRLTVKYEENGIRNKKNLILKVQSSEATAPLFDKLELVNREIFAYEVILPRINNLSDQLFTPFHFKTTDSKIIILENLTSLGYKSGEEMRSPLTLDQNLSIIKVMANFHAISHKVSQTEPHLLQNRMCQYSVFLELSQITTAFWEPILFELLTRNNAASSIPKLKQLTDYLQKDDNDAQSRIHYSNFEFVALNHDDFRIGNLQLKFGPQDIVDGVKIIDFQTCFWSTPIHDFMNFFAREVTTETLVNHYDTILDSYLESLNETLRKFDCTRLYSRADFERDLKSLNFCLVLQMTWIAFTLYPLDRPKLLSAILGGIEDEKDKIYYREICLKDEILTSRILSLCKLYEKLGLFEA